MRELDGLYRDVLNYKDKGINPYLHASKQLRLAASRVLNKVIPGVEKELEKTPHRKIACFIDGAKKTAQAYHTIASDNLRAFR